MDGEQRRRQGGRVQLAARCSRSIGWLQGSHLTGPGIARPPGQRGGVSGSRQLSRFLSSRLRAVAWAWAWVPGGHRQRQHVGTIQSLPRRTRQAHVLIALIDPHASYPAFSTLPRILCPRSCLPCAGVELKFSEYWWKTVVPSTFVTESKTCVLTQDMIQHMVPTKSHLRLLYYSLPLSSRSTRTSSTVCGCSQSAAATLASMGGNGRRGSPPYPYSFSSRNFVPEIEVFAMV